MEQTMTTSNYPGGETFTEQRNIIRWLFLQNSHKVHTEKWQGWDISKKPEMESHELLNVTFTIDLKGIEELQHWREDIQPNLPWADDHFLERVCGEPINPGVEWANWPWGESARRFIEEGGQFNHNYMERYWPRHAGLFSQPTRTREEFVALRDELEHWPDDRRGIRWQYGDLNDLVALLVDQPLTRQAWMPIFFPEDTGYGDGGRKPCSLGYQFIVRGGKLHVYYPLRSCDFIRHWADDCYLTVRLLLWVLEKCRERNPVWKDVVPGSYTMHCTSFHIFRNDWHTLEAENARHSLR